MKKKQPKWMEVLEFMNILPHVHHYKRTKGFEPMICDCGDMLGVNGLPKRTTPLEDYLKAEAKFLKGKCIDWRHCRFCLPQVERWRKNMKKTTRKYVTYYDSWKEKGKWKKVITARMPILSAKEWKELIKPYEN